MTAQASDDGPGPREGAPPPLGAIFLAFLLVGATSFGGGAVAHLHAAVVGRKKWVDEGRFLEAVTVGRSLPGPNVTNLAAFLGAMLAGYRGAAVAVLGVVAPGLAAVLLLAAIYAPLAAASSRPSLRGGVEGLTAGAVGVMASLLAHSAKPAARARGGLALAAAALVAVAALRLNLLVVLAALVPLASAVNRERAP
ncbi:MAG TPA: chromate transporter [Polyangiaceae bacterium]|nr:chromate transporter [Polyangiaceae bacterium]